MGGVTVDPDSEPTIKMFRFSTATEDKVIKHNCKYLHGSSWLDQSIFGCSNFLKILISSYDHPTFGFRLILRIK